MTSLQPPSHRARRWLAASLLAALAAGGGAGLRPLAAGDSDNAQYASRVGEALALTRQGKNTEDRDAERQAADLLVVDGVDTQPEIQDRLRAGGYTNASQAEVRLLTLQEALTEEAATPDAATATAKLRTILARPEYQASQPSLFDRAVDWIVRRVADLLRGFGLGGGAANWLLAAEVAVAAAVLLLLVFFIARAAAGRGAPGASRWRLRGGGFRSAADYFAAADRFAAGGDWAAALRALTSAVATRVGGPGAWEQSPLTVRELFRGRGLLDELRALLVPFESAMYGHHAPDADTYERARAAAAPYRVEGDAAPARQAGGGRRAT